MQTVDLIVEAGWIIPVVPSATVLPQHSLVVQNGRIIDLLPIAIAQQQYQAQQVQQLTRHVLIPGLINAHTHAAMSLLRGKADDLPLMTWLQQHIWPAEQRWVDEDFVYDGTLLAISEMLRSGTTCFADMYFFPDQVARAAELAGIRACLGLIVLDFPTVWASNAEEYLQRALKIHDQYNHSSLLSTCFAPHAPYTVSDKPFSKIQTLADELDIPIMCHIHETRAEIDTAVAQHGKRPLARLHELGLLSPALLAVHMTQLTAAEIDLLAELGCHVIHCPESNMKLASGYCPVTDLLNKGVNVALGTDGAASNNDLDMFGELRTAALLAKHMQQDAQVVSAMQALEMATINGARALGLADEIGSLEIGKAADVVAIDLSAANTQPVYNPISQLVYALNSRQVSHVWIAGQAVMQQHKLLTLDAANIQQRCQNWFQKIQESVDE